MQLAFTTTHVQMLQGCFSRWCKTNSIMLLMGILLPKLTTIIGCSLMHFIAECGIERSALPLATNGTQEQSPNSRTPISYLNISELPLNRKEIGNTLETRGLTYSSRFTQFQRTLILGAKEQN